MNAPRKILIVNPFGIGDVLFSTPLIRAARRAWPRAHLAYVCNRRTEHILKRNPHLDELFIYEKDELLRLWRQRRREGLAALCSLISRIRRARFDLAIDLSLGERYGFVLMALGIPRRIGFDFRRRGRFLTHRFPMEGYQRQHVVDYYVELLERIGIRALERQLELRSDDAERLAAERLLALHGLASTRPLIGLVPAGGISWGIQAGFRRWSKEGFIAVGRRLAERHGARLLVFGETGDRDVCADIVRAIGSAAVDLSGQTKLGEFIALVARCHLIIANDGGPVHIAVSQDVPTVSIFGPVDPIVYGPYPPGPRHRTVYKEALPCRPCYHRFRLPPCPYDRACLTELAPSDVLDACEAVLRDCGEATAHGA